MNEGHRVVYVVNPAYQGNINPAYQGNTNFPRTAFEVQSRQQYESNVAKGKANGERKKINFLYSMKLISFIVGIVSLLISYDSLVSTCTNFKSDCSGYVYTDCVQTEDAPLCTYTWNTTNCTLFDGKNPDSYVNSYQTFAYWLQDQGDEKCPGGTLPVNASCSEYCQTLSCSPGYVMGAYVIFILPFAAPIPDGDGGSVLEKIIDIFMTGITSIAVKVTRLAAEAYMAYPVSGGQSDFLAMELLVSTGILAVIYGICCPMACKSCGGGNSGWKSKRTRLVGARFGTGFWASMIAIIVIASAGVSFLRALPMSGSFLYDPQVVGYGVVVSVGAVLLQGVLEFFGIFSCFINKD